MKAKVLYTGKIVEVKLNLNSQPTAKSGAKVYMKTLMGIPILIPNWISKMFILIGSK